MAEIHIGALPEGTKRCQICAEPINKNAKKCIHCQSDQDRILRRIGLSSTVLSLLVALISVLTAAIPVIKTAVTPKDSHLEFSFQRISNDSLTILASNSGNRPGVLQDVSIAIIAPSGSAVVDLKQENATSGRPIIIDSEKSLIIAFNFLPGQQTQAARSTEAGAKCALTIKFIDFSSKPPPTMIPLKCADLTTFFRISPGGGQP